MTKKGRREKITSFLKGFILFCLIFGIFSAGLIAFWISTLKIPDIESFSDRKIIQSTKIYDRTGKILLWDVHKNIQRTVVPFGEISRHLKNTTVAIEDSSFYQHKGIDFKAVVRAVLVNTRTMSFAQGFSTITQQLIKNAFLTKEKSIARKVKEIILTLKAEKELTKEEILNLYLNEIPYGGSNYGAEAASNNFFGKKASELTLAESAYLAALPKAPTYYSPYGEHRDKLEQRKNLVLKRMTKLGFITKKEEEKAVNEEVKFLNKGDRSIKAPHFSIFIRLYLEEKYGKDAVEQEGLKVITTLDYDLQQSAENIITEYAKTNIENFNADNAALVGIDPKTGQVLTMVGSKDYFNVEDQGNFNVALAKRQPGSTIKPFIYATAFKKGLLPETVVFDLKTEFNSSCNPDGTQKEENTQKEGEEIKQEDACYMPGNYDNVFRGPVSLRNALAQSINIPAIKTLYLSGLVDSLKTIKDMGITTLTDPNRYGLTLVLGGGEVSLLELTGGYSVFANQGSKNNLVSILKIENSKGKVIEKFEAQPKQVLDKNVSLLITDILSDNEARTPAFGARSWLYFPDRQVAAKTGTTNDYRDAWIIGYTPSLAVGVWVGNNDNTPMEKKVAGFIVAPIWNAFFKEAFNKLPIEEFEKPTLPNYNEIKPIVKGIWQVPVSTTTISTTSPLLTTLSTTTEIHSILNWVDKKDPLGPEPTNPEKDSQYNSWEEQVQKWVEEQKLKP